MRRWGVFAGLMLLPLGVAQGWSEEAAQQLVQEGILYGYPDGALRLDANITRGEMAAMLWRLILQYRLKDLRDLTKEDIEALKGLLRAVELWRKEVQGSQEAVAGLSDRLKTLEGKLASLEGELSTLAGKGVEASREALAQVGEVAARLSDLEGVVYRSLKDYREEMNTLAGALRDVDGKLKAFEESFSQGLEGNRKLLEEKWAALSASLAQLGNRLAAVEAASAKVSELEKRLSGLSGRVDSLEEAVRSLKEEVARLRKEIPRSFTPKPFGLAVYLTGLDSGFAQLDYTLPSGLSLRVLGALGGLGPYGSLGVGYRGEGQGIGYRMGLGLGYGLYGPGFLYGEGSFGLKVDLVAGVSLALEGLQSYPLGSGPIVSRFGVGVMYRW
ncbi:S-layer homology domain-containing protein [Thermus albus]|uniref:S-layer homology domain-containing protein n=1 Tax=Thermus albus TaxID=2908146 RepID=UPI001FAA337B|nr:S-layer homology domain-containing protein [Thermus albus]